MLNKNGREKESSVYWIHKEDHTDILSQGYVGFVSTGLHHRWGQHRRSAENGNGFVFHRAISKYGYENLKKSVVCIGTADYCLFIENRLRPKRNIGWNIAIGGDSPALGRKMSDKGRLAVSKAQTGRIKTSEERIRIGDASRGRIPTAQARLNMSIAGKIRGFSDTHKKNISISKKGKPTGVPPWAHNNTDPEMWLKSEEIYIDWIRGKSIRSIDKDRGWRVGKSKFVIGMFRIGWKPSEDQVFQEWISNR